MKYMVGDRFSVGSDKYMIVLTVNWKDSRVYHFQLINLQTGNRYSDNVVTHHFSVDSGLILDKTEVEFMLDEYPALTEIILTSHEKGANWEENEL